MTTQTRTISVSKFIQAGLIGGAIAAILNLILYFIGQALNGGALLVAPRGAGIAQPIPWFMVIVLSIVPGVVAGLLYGVLGRFMDKPTPVFLIIAAIVFIVYFFFPIMIVQGTLTIFVLELMHVVVAALVIWFILRAKN
jgi:Family of unknown function (DUF6069)